MEKSEVTKRPRLIIIGGSAGSLEVLMNILPNLEKIAAAIVIVLHRKGSEDTILEEIISLKSHIRVVPVEDKTAILPGYIYIAPANYHMLFEKDFTISLDSSAKVNYSRPSIDVSFESAAQVYGENLVGILLSGANNDGTQGLIAIQNHSGKTVVQSPESAEIAVMPENAIKHMHPDYIIDYKEIINFLSTYQ